MPHERPRYTPIMFEFPRREEMENRIKACGENIHSPYSWYRNDVNYLLIMLDFLNTKLHEKEDN